MHKIKFLLLTVLLSTLAACSTFSTTSNSGKLERVGVLLVQDCTDQAECTQFSLLEQDLQTPSVALSGQLSKAMQGQLIAILGMGSGGKNGLELIKVEQSQAITKFDYQPFLSKAVSNYVRTKYDCVSFWDQNYSWRLDGRQPIFTASLTHPFEADKGSITLSYDGLTKKLISATAKPDSANPCQIR